MLNRLAVGATPMLPCAALANRGAAAAALLAAPACCAPLLAKTLLGLRRLAAGSLATPFSATSRPMFSLLHKAQKDKIRRHNNRRGSVACWCTKGSAAEQT